MRCRVLCVVALALKGSEWRKPGLVALVSKLAASAGPHAPIDVKVPAMYERATGPNTWVAIETTPHQAPAVAGQESRNVAVKLQLTA